MKKIFQIKKQRDISTIIEDSFSFFKSHAKNILKIIWEQNRIILTGLIITYFFYVYYYFGMLNNIFNLKGVHSSEMQIFSSPYFSLLIFALFIFSLIFTPRFFAAITGYFRVYDEQTGKADAEKVKELVQNKFWGLIGLSLLIGFLAILILVFTSLILAGIMSLLGSFGVFIFIVIYFSLIIYGLLYFGLSYYVYFFEDIGVFEAIMKTKTYLKGKFWFSFGVFVVMGIIILLISGVVNAPVSLYVIFKTVWMVKNPDVTQYTGQGDFVVAFFSVISYLGQMILRVLMIMAMTFLYFSLKEYHTGEGLLGKINQIGSKEDA